MNPEQIKLFYEPPGTLRMTLSDEKSYLKVGIFQSSPLSRPGKYIALLDSKSEEIALVTALTDFAPESQQIVEEELRRRYLTAKIQKITSVKQEFGVTYWHVVTDRGERDFVVQSISESCLWLSDAHILIVDVDGNRFEIEDRTQLDFESKKRLDQVL
jgi:hypothetical protein